ncbi:hypothetical protein EJB05_23656 [Eragrostis curvula]|uniref:DUF4378 domain-containing protein n=1 Tax=Eragrostis curvula TaxID=38414 RepID=A0A5J9V8X8_9POAL|nr:hypothetical protein EJB05_23656 [Eragrostis curvula]
MHAAGGEHEEAMEKRGAKEEGSSWGSEADDKEQLSPVAVMDFPCFDDGECSPSLDDSLLSRLQTGRKTHKIRRFGGLDEIAPVDLEARLAASQDPDDEDNVPAQQHRCHGDETTSPSPSSSHRVTDVHDEPDPDENELLMLIVDTVSDGVDDAVSKRLLLDFFVEMKLERRSQDAGLHAPRRKAERLEDGEILAAARGWLLDGAGTEQWGLIDVLRGGTTVVAEMERGRRWMQVSEEEREVGAMVARMLSDQLVDEVVRDLSV